MQKEKPTYDSKWIIASIIILIVVSIAFHFYWGLTKFIIRWILELKFTYFLLWVSTVGIFILHYIRHKDKEVKSEPIITRKFGVFADNVGGGFGYATSITTCLTLLKGLYIQKFFGEKYFTEFNGIDLTAVFIVVAFLLYMSIMKVFDIGKEAYKVQKTEKVLDKNKQLVIQKSDDEIILELAEKNTNEDSKISEERIKEIIEESK